MTDLAHPAWVYLAGALLAAVVPRRGRVPLLLAVPGAALALGLWLPEGRETAARFLGQEVVLLRADRLSLVFGTVFVIMGLLGTVFALHVRERGPHVAAFAYVGSALGVVFAGDLLTLFVFWELMSVSSAFLILQRRTAKALAAGFRYLMVHAFGGACLLAGLLLRAAAGEGLRFEAMALTGATALILLGFAVNAAIPPLSAWLTDAYPEGTVTGSVFLSAFTTKAAVYALARGFPGVELLVWAGAVMALYGVVFAVLENDIRRLLAYHIVSQVGYMVTGVGLGTALAISGTAAHAFSHILYKGLLFMATGAVLHVTGRSKLTELGGLWRGMPVTLVLYTVGAFSISGVPLFNGFVSKSLVVAAAEAEHRAAVEWMLAMASVGTFLHTGLKLPFFTFFAADRGVHRREPPGNMLLAMGLAAVLCVGIGVAPGFLYRILPFPVAYEPYTAPHVVTTLQLLLGTGVGFMLLVRHLGGEPTVTLDTDWVYRRGGRLLLGFCQAWVRASARGTAALAQGIGRLRAEAGLGPGGAAGRGALPVGYWVVISLGLLGLLILAL
ncbi:MAG: Na(+)/H(+) antiporter subunit D [Candidatus Rokubacteria bacterium]|nr:Na(+)/H(+) antiporter subunit D [Candidatus Rokubacteria bacterium]